MVENLMNFNAFGLVRVERCQVTTTITAITAKGRPINRTVTEDVTEIIGIAPDEYASFVFGATIIPGEKSRVAIREITHTRSDTDVDNTPQVRGALDRALEFIRTKAA